MQISTVRAASERMASVADRLPRQLLTNRDLIAARHESQSDPANATMEAASIAPPQGGTWRLFWAIENKAKIPLPITTAVNASTQNVS
jgi:hypothetical protein